MNGQFEFFNVDEMETMATCEHFMATDVEWDPTGRFVTTAVTGVHQMENGYHCWTFNGRLLYKQTRERFFQFLWRPRGKSLLSKAQEAEIKNNLKKYSKKFEEEDLRIKNQQATMLDEAKQATKEKWEAWVEEKKRKIESDEYQGELKKILGASYASQSNAQTVTIEEEEEEIISVVEEPL
jgi:translation initiation factor 3 subunit B